VIDQEEVGGRAHSSDNGGGATSRMFFEVALIMSFIITPLGFRINPMAN
jgi:hypothetical protein